MPGKGDLMIWERFYRNNGQSFGGKKRLPEISVALPTYPLYVCLKVLPVLVEKFPDEKGK